MTETLESLCMLPRRLLWRGWWRLGLWWVCLPFPPSPDTFWELLDSTLYMGRWFKFFPTPACEVITKLIPCRCFIRVLWPNIKPQTLYIIHNRRTYQVQVLAQ
jgi:hypothetical protein